MSESTHVTGLLLRLAGRCPFRGPAELRRPPAAPGPGACAPAQPRPEEGGGDELARARAVFELFDSDGDGLLHKAELQLYLAQTLRLGWGFMPEKTRLFQCSPDEAAAALERIRAAGSDPAAIKRRRSGMTGGYDSPDRNSGSPVDDSVVDDGDDGGSVAVVEGGDEEISE